MVDFRALETLVWVVTLKSFRGAAEKLNTTQPAISQRIAALERDLGHELIDRADRKVTLTAMGRRVLDHAERLIQARAEMLAELANPAAVRGSLSIGVNETIASTWLATLFERLTTTYPGIDLAIDIDVSDNLHKRVLSQDLDLALMLRPAPSAIIETCDLCDYPLAFIASKHLELGDGIHDEEALARFPILTFARNTLPYLAIHTLFARPYLPRLQIRACTSLAMIVRLTRDGHGIAVVPPAIVAQELSDGRLVQLNVPMALPDLSCVAAWRKGPNALLVQAATRLAVEIASGKTMAPGLSHS